jgi:hypothetical protein
MKNIAIIYIALLSSLFAVSSAQAETLPAPGWRVVTKSLPTNLPPGSSGELVSEVFNIGAVPSAAGATLTDVLPAHITAVSQTTPEGQRWECAGSSPEICTLSLPSIAAGSADIEREEIFVADKFDLRVTVGADAGESGPEVNSVTVAGGGAPAPASATDAIAVSATPAGFGLAGLDAWVSNANGTLDTQAGSHPYEATFVLTLNTLLKGSLLLPSGEARDVLTELPRGAVANPDAAPQCTREELDVTGQGECPVASQIGETVISLEHFKFKFPLYNMVPPPGLPAQFGFTLANVATFIDGSVRSGGDDGLDGSVEDIVQGRSLKGAIVTFWGVPADPSHDPQRCSTLVLEHGGGLKGKCGLKDEGGQSTPFLTLPTACGGPLSTTVALGDWENPTAPLQEASFQMPPITGCEHLAFPPQISLAPDTSYADTPAGLTVEVKVPQEGLNSADDLSAADIENTTVALPAGVDINPGQAAGLQACGQPESALGTTNAPSCPHASKVGEVHIKTPLLESAAEKELVGNVYVMQSNPPNLKLLVAASGDGVNIKLVGDVSLCENTGEVIAGPGPVADRTCAAPGQLITKFTETPELPFTDFKLTFSGGAQAALATPTQCGSYTTTADFESWANPFIDEIFPTSEFQITNGPGGGSCSSNPLPFSPELIAGSTTDQAGGFTNFSLLLQRGDGQQRIDGLQFKAPAGLTGELSKVPLCTNAQAETNTCPEASKIGHTVVESGPGPYPLVVPEPGQEPAPIYLTGPYNGSGACTPGEPGCAPFGLSIVVPLHVGPFTLQTQRVRAKIELNPLTAALTVTTNPLPQVVDGVPTDLREIDSVIERPEFMINPTNCNSSQFSGTAYGTQPPGGGGDFTGQPDIAAPISSHFGVGACQALKFEPKISVSTSGKTSKTDGASLTYKVAYPNTPQGTQSDIRYVKVELPGELPSRLTTLQKACTAAQFDANPAGCPVPSVIGHAVVHTQLLPVPLEGPVYFVSNGGEAFPNLEMVLQGDGVTVDLIGDTLIKNGVTSTTFKAVPDQPFQTFEITLPEGPYSALAANGDLCKPTVTETVKKKVRVRVRGHERTVTRKVKEQVAAALTIPSEYIGQNGAPYKADVPISVTGCPKAVHPDKVKKKAHRKGKKAK